MKKIIKWINFALFMMFLTVIFFMLYLNKEVDAIKFDYIISDTVLSLPAIISIVFLAGAVCGITVTLLLSISKFGVSFRQKRELKAAKKSLKELQEETAL